MPKKSLKQEIADNIMEIRRKLGLTQDAFCSRYNQFAPKHLKINRSTLSKYESGDIMPPADKYLKILEMEDKIL